MEDSYDLATEHFAKVGWVLTDVGLVVVASTQTSQAELTVVMEVEVGEVSAWI